MSLTVGSLFSGIGGLDLGLERAGMRVIWQSEIDPYACKVLKKHWPEVPNYGDIKEIKWEKVARPDVICGGYPCQPFSQAGKRRGEEDPRHLWPWVREAISELQPRYAVLENVRGHLSMGGLSVIGELASIGYDAEWCVVSAASVGANHRRDRIIIVAYPDSCNSSNGRQREVISSEDRSRRDDRGGSGSDTREVCMEGARQSQRNVADTDDAGGGTSRNQIDENWSTQKQGWDDKSQSRTSGRRSTMADTDGERLERRGRVQGSKSQSCGLDIQSADIGRTSDMADADSWETCRRIRSISEDSGLVFGRENLRRGTEGYAGWQWWEFEPDVGRVAHGVSSRVDRLKGLGNAVVPQVAEVIGRLIMEADA